MATSSRDDFTRAAKEQFEINVTAAIRVLLEVKHLYQSVTVQPTDKYLQQKPRMITAVRQPITSLGSNRAVPQRAASVHNPPAVSREPEMEEQSLPLVAQAIRGAWSVEPRHGNAGEEKVAFIRPPDVKLYCSRAACRRVEAFNLVHAVDVLARNETAGFRDGEETEQAFILTYRCQSCKGTPEVFLIRRRALKLTIEGRSPIEHVDVPAYIPKQVKQFYSVAVVAHQSGQTLPGNFMLRTLIEQWARFATGSSSQWADQVLDAYMATLPEDFKGRFASMRALYDLLSSDIHGATGSPDLFEKARAEIAEHFDARRMFKLALPEEGRPDSSSGAGQPG